MEDKLVYESVMGLRGLEEMPTEALRGCDEFDVMSKIRLLSPGRFYAISVIASLHFAVTERSDSSVPRHRHNRMKRLKLKLGGKLGVSCVCRDWI